MVEVTQRLRDVLAEQRFPAARWELIACAQHYGADVHTLRELHALPEAIFRGLTDVERVVADPNSAALRPRTFSLHLLHLLGADGLYL